MAHRLVAHNGARYLNPRLVLARLGFTFAYVESDEDAGRKYVGQLVRQLQGLVGSQHHFDADYLLRLKNAQRDAIYVCFGDNPGSELACLDTAVIPGEPLYFDYLSRAHEQATRPLLRRCAEVLGYDVVEMHVENAFDVSTHPGKVQAAAQRRASAVAA